MSSRNPHRVFFVPQEIIDFADGRSEVVCNLRPGQRPKIGTNEEARIR